MQKLLNFIMENWEQGLGIAAIVYELAARFIPTEKNRSILDLAFKIVSVIVKNRRKPSPIDETLAGSQSVKNKILVDRAKHIVYTLLILVSVSAGAQTNSTFKAARSYNADSLTVQTEVTGLESMYDSVGALYYNRQASPAKWRIFYNHAWHDLIQSGGGGGGLTGANNGLHISGANAQLGGTLNQNTTVSFNTGSYALTFDATNDNTNFSLGNNVHLEANDNMELIATDYSIDGSTMTANIDDITVFDSNFTLFSNVNTTLGGTDVLLNGTNSITGNTNAFGMTTTSSITLNSDDVIGNTAGNTIFNTVTNASGTISNESDIFIATNILGNKEISFNATDLTIQNNTGDVFVSASGDLDLTANSYTLSGIAAASPSTMFFRGDGVWAVPGGGGGSPGGADTDIQFNDSGAFGGESAFTYNQTTDLATLTGDFRLVNTGVNGRLFDSSDGTPTGTRNSYLSYNISGTAASTFLGSTDGTRSGSLSLSGNNANGAAILSATNSGGGLGSSSLQMTSESATKSALLATIGTGTNTNRIVAQNSSTPTASAELLLTPTVITLRNTGATTAEQTISANAITFTPPSGGFIVFQNLPTSCSGVPTNGLANVGGVLTICP